MSATIAKPSARLTPADRPRASKPTSGDSRSRSAPRAIYIHRIDSPVGPLLIGTTETAVCMVEFTDTDRPPEQLDALCRLLDATPQPGCHELTERVVEELGQYFAGRRKSFDVPMAYPGTAFQESVWRSLLEIPYGHTWSYEALALRVGRPTGQRAVGTANGRNRLAIMIPCHRVINKNGALGGYGGGPERKEFLLSLERREVTL